MEIEIKKIHLSSKVILAYDNKKDDVQYVNLHNVSSGGVSWDGIIGIHNGGRNYLFVDGHVTWIKGEDVEAGLDENPGNYFNYPMWDW